MNVYEETVSLINRAAEAFKQQNRAEFRSSEIRDWIQQQEPARWPVIERSFQGYFSTATGSDGNCLIERVPGRFRYRIVEDDVLVDEGEEFSDVADFETSDEAEEEKSAVHHQRESMLYSLLRDWLESKNYEAAVTANMTKGGRWGNPDVTGIRSDELLLGQVFFESATIEAKLSSDSWRYWIFESVAHKRFAHRAWYAFAVGTDAPSLERVKDAEKMCEYAEKYRIGILVVFIAKDQYEQLTKGNPNQVVLGPDDARVEVLWPAFYEQVQVSALNEFLKEVLNIRSLNDLKKFGG